MNIKDLPQTENNEVIRNYLLTHLGDKGLELDVVENDGNIRLYHISNDPKIPYFEPRFSTKTYPGENAQIPRTSTSPSIGQCLQGYGPIHNENNQGGWGKKEQREKWNGVYHVYEPLWQMAFKPDEKLVGDVKWSDEHWLLYYKPEHYRRPASIVAQFFLHSLTTRYKGKQQVHDLTIYIKVNGAKGVDLSPSIHLSKGFYKVELLEYKSPEFDYRLAENVFVDVINEQRYSWAYAQRTTMEKSK